MKEPFLYRRLYDALRAKIESGALQAGDRLPNEARLAREHGVSAITVKKALSLLAGDALIVREPGRGSFVTGQTERSFRGSREQAPPLIGAVLEHVSSPFGLEMLYAMDRALDAAGYALYPCFSYGDRGRETRQIGRLLAIGARGLIVMPAHGQYYSTAILRLVVDRFPLVLVDKQLDGVPVAAVCTDNAAAAAVLVRHLYAAGRRRIGLVSTDDCTSSVAERRAGFFGALADLGLEPGADCRLPLDMSRSTENQDEQTTRALAAFLRSGGSRLDGVVCTEYGYLAHLMRAARQIGMRIPGQLAVCSIDEDDLAPGGYFFTHVKQDEAAIARKAAALLLEQIGGGQPRAVRYSVPGIFRPGRSTVAEEERRAAPRAGGEEGDV